MDYVGSMAGSLPRTNSGPGASGSRGMVVVGEDAQPAHGAAAAVGAAGGASSSAEPQGPIVAQLASAPSFTVVPREFVIGEPDGSSESAEEEALGGGSGNGSGNVASNGSPAPEVMASMGGMEGMEDDVASSSVDEESEEKEEKIMLEEKSEEVKRDGVVMVAESGGAQKGELKDGEFSDADGTRGKAAKGLLLRDGEIEGFGAVADGTSVEEFKKQEAGGQVEKGDNGERVEESGQEVPS